jgi:hypothetical protein
VSAIVLWYEPLQLDERSRYHPLEVAQRAVGIKGHDRHPITGYHQHGL